MIISVVSRLTAPASSGDWKMQTFKIHPRSTESETLRVGPEMCVLVSTPGDFDAWSSLITAAKEDLIIATTLLSAAGRIPLGPCKTCLSLSQSFYAHFPGGSEVKASTYNAGDRGSISGSGRFPWRREWQPTTVFLPGESHGWRSLVGYISPWGCKESNITEWLHFTSCYT